MFSRTAGFSLIEVFIYIGVFMVVSIGSILLLFSLQDMVYEHRANQVMTRNITGVFERMMLDLRSADEVNVGASTLAADPGVLVVVAGPTTTTYALASGALTVSVNGGTAYPLTDDAVTVTNLRFDHYDSGVSEAVRTALTLEASWGTITTTRSFTNSSVLLSSYD